VSSFTACLGFALQNARVTERQLSALRIRRVAFARCLINARLPLDGSKRWIREQEQPESQVVKGTASNKQKAATSSAQGTGHSSNYINKKTSVPHLTLANCKTKECLNGSFRGRECINYGHRASGRNGSSQC